MKGTISIKGKYFCSKCGVEKNSYNTSRNGFKFQSYCKICASEKARNYRESKNHPRARNDKKFREEFFNINEDAIYC